MKTYSNHLGKNGYSSKSIGTWLKVMEAFNEWCKKFGTSPEAIDYKTFLRYIEELRKRNLKPRTLKSYVSNLKTYFDYLAEEKIT